MSPRYFATVAEADRIRATGYRFDSSFRHADPNAPTLAERMKAAFYAQVCTVAANDIADDPAAAARWARCL